MKVSLILSSLYITYHNPYANFRIQDYLEVTLCTFQVVEMYLSLSAPEECFGDTRILADDFFAEVSGVDPLPGLEEAH